jgi:hypothetical protein
MKRKPTNPHAAMTDAELAAAIARLDGERQRQERADADELRRHHKQLQLQANRLKGQQQKLRQERNRRACETLRTLTDAELTATMNAPATEHWLSCLIEAERKRRREQREQQAQPQFAAMTDDQLLALADNPAGRTELELRAAITELQGRGEQLERQHLQRMRQLRAAISKLHEAAWAANVRTTSARVERPPRITDRSDK